jgi:hypothetical protein
VSLMLDPLGHVRAESDANAKNAATVPAPLVPVVVPPAPVIKPNSFIMTPTVVPAEPPIAQFIVGGSPMVSLGRGPVPTLGAQLFAGAQFDRASLHLEASFETTLGAINLNADRVLARFFLVGPAICYAVSVLLPCAFASVGVAQGQAPDALRASLQTSLVAFAGIRLGVPFTLARATVRNQKVAELVPWVQASGALIRTRFEIGTDTLWTAPPISVSVGVSLAWLP